MRLETLRRTFGDMQPAAQQPGDDAPWRPWFFLAVAMMALAIVVLVAAVAGADFSAEAAGSVPASTGEEDDATPASEEIDTAQAYSSGGGPPEEYSQKLRVLATWYNLEGGAFAPDSPDYGTTSTGTQAAWGTCAVDPSVIPLNTRFYVPGYGWCEALDTGAGVVGLHVDLFFPDEVGDPGWGEQYVDIYIE